MADIDFESLAARLLPNARGLCRAWFPAGKTLGHEWCVGSLLGEPGDSLRINLNTGIWKDFADDAKGGRDLISLFAAQRGLSQPEAARQLSNGHAGEYQAPVVRAKPERRVLGEVPASLLIFDCRHVKFGVPSRVWDYVSADGKLLSKVARYDTPDGKEFIPWTVAEYGDGGRIKWSPGAAPSPRPLYGRHQLAQYPAAAVVVTEGEKAADAAQRLCAGCVAVTWAGGALAAAKTDFKPLHGRTVTLWPDADEPGAKAMWQLAHALKGKCTSVRLIFPAGVPVGWDAADAETDGTDWDTVQSWARQIWPEPAVKESLTTEPDSSRAPRSRTDAWQIWGLQMAGKSEPRANMTNMRLVLELDPRLKGLAWFDKFYGSIMTTRDGKPAEWTDDDDAKVLNYMQLHVGIETARLADIRIALPLVARANPRNCVTDWTDGLTWDSVDRIAHCFSDYFGAVDSEYVRAASRNFWLSMLARVYKPGCKQDHMVVLEGSQGPGKSTMLHIIGGDWFAEQSESVQQSKPFAEVLRGKMLLEIAEMDSFRGDAIEAIKRAISCQSDRYREPFARHAADHPRQCVFVGTTNSDDWQRDPTGARRFWPIKCASKMDPDGLRQNREQLFAEAALLIKAGADWWTMPAGATLAEQRSRYDEDAWHGEIADWCDRQFDGTGVTMSEVLIGAVHKKLEDITRADQLRVAKTLRILGFEKRLMRKGKEFQKAWFRPESPK